MSPAATRPASYDEFKRRIRHMISPKGLQQGLALKLTQTDVVISPFPKCGTTWLQQVVHSLRTGGDLDFDDISEVVPWIETAFDLGQDLDAPQRANPRAFKSHLGWDAVPKGGRYIVALRDPRDALVSLFRFMEGWYFEAGSIDIETFARGEFLARDGRDYWEHLASWWRQRDRDDVLLLAYEHMHADLPATVQSIAAFIGVPLTPTLLVTVLSESSLTSMQAHKHKYDDKLMRERSEQVCGLPPGSDSAKVRSGKVGSHQELPATIIVELDAIWAETIHREFGLADYPALLNALQGKQ
ncbi:MAG: sulfotransferase domain-containing protein [Gammaproteobacteria bacterium]|nr:sulfotransferase domain-containing protein [Gammaproteobacteria bacterium]